MSEANRQELMNTLIALDREEQAWVINFLVQKLAGLPSTKKKIVKRYQVLKLRNLNQYKFLLVH